MQLSEPAQALQKQLQEAQATLTPFDWQPYLETLSSMDEAYQLARENFGNQQPAAYKVALTSSTAQAAYDYDQPAYGQLMADQLLTSPGKVNLAEHFGPLLEVEVGFRVDQVPSPDDSLEELLSKLSVVPAVEMPDSRFKDWLRKINKELFVADNAMANQLLLGPVSKQKFNVDELPDVHMNLWHDDQLVCEPSAEVVLGNPLKSVQWLVQKLAEQGHHLEVRQFVTTGLTHKEVMKPG